MDGGDRGIGLMIEGWPDDGLIHDIWLGVFLEGW